MDKSYNNCSTQVDREKLEKYKKVKKNFQTAKTVVVSVGTLATIIMAVCPLDGPFGEIISLIATGALEVVISGAEKIYDNVVDINNPETDTNENINNIAAGTKEVTDEIRKVISSVKKYDQNGNTVDVEEGRAR